MKIELSYAPADLDELQLRDRNVVVIDVLRSSTTVITALSNGAREVIPVATIESAVKISGSLFGDVTLRGGERNGKIIQGFNLGNSPLEYTEAVVRGKSIIFCTTNGSVAMVKSRYARNLALGGFVNLMKVVEFIKEINSDALIICAGRASAVSSFSIEDAVCAGMIVAKLKEDPKIKLELTDSSMAAHSLYKTFGRSILKMMKNADHGKYLIEIGFQEDVKICAAVDSNPVLPIQVGSVIKLRKDVPRGGATEEISPSSNTSN